MAKKMTSDDWFARMEAYDEAATHIAMFGWADSDQEFEQGKIVSEQIRKLGDKARDNALKCLEKENKK